MISRCILGCWFCSALRSHGNSSDGHLGVDRGSSSNVQLFLATAKQIEVDYCVPHEPALEGNKRGQNHENFTRASLLHTDETHGTPPSWHVRRCVAYTGEEITTHPTRLVGMLHTTQLQKKWSSHSVATRPGGHDQHTIIAEKRLRREGVLHPLSFHNRARRRRSPRTRYALI